MNCEKDNYKTQTHFQPVNGLNKPINSYLKIKTKRQEVSGQEKLRKIKVFSDGSHLAPINGNKPTQTKSAVLIYDENDVCIEKISIIHPEGWSNTAETYAVLDGLNKLIDLNLQNECIEWFNDSQCVMYVLAGKYKSHSRSEHNHLIIKCIELLTQFKHIRFNWIPREQNKIADELSKF